MAADNTRTVDSANGWWMIDAETGDVLEVHETSGSGGPLFNIARFDLAEWRRWCADNTIGTESAIYWLEIGYWTPDGTYEAAEDVFRDEYLRTRDD